jgi:pimeloyl-ACP methyl ester carboxylesterase
MAAAQSSDVAFLVSFSGPGVSYAEVNQYADARRLAAQGFPERDIRAAMQALQAVDDYVRHGGDGSRLQSLLDEAWKTPWAAKTTLPRRVPRESEIRSWLRWRDLDLDPADFWQQLKIPCLVLFGESDDVVPASRSASRIEAALKRAGNKDVTIRIFPGANHTIEGDPEFLRLMAKWVSQRSVSAGRR